MLYLSFSFRLMNPFFKALQRMHKDHINAVLGESTGMCTKQNYIGKDPSYFVHEDGRMETLGSAIVIVYVFLFP